MNRLANTMTTFPDAILSYTKSRTGYKVTVLCDSNLFTVSIRIPFHGAVGKIEC